MAFMRVNQDGTKRFAVTIELDEKAFDILDDLATQLEKSTGTTARLVLTDALLAKVGW
jgi:hypothetical protein